MGEIVRCDASDLCFELSGGNDTAYARVYGAERPDRVLDSADRFAVLADMSPLMVGHCLLVPRVHYLNFGAVAANEPTFEAYLGKIATRYQSVFEKLTFIEHGSSNDMRGSACISHAHLHLLPLPLSLIVGEMTRDGLPISRARRWEDMMALSDSDEPYYLASSVDETFVAVTKVPLPKQYLRKVVARALALDEVMADWALISFPEYLYETVRIWDGGRGDRGSSAS